VNKLRHDLHRPLYAEFAKAASAYPACHGRCFLVPLGLSAIPASGLCDDPRPGAVPVTWVFWHGTVPSVICGLPRVPLPSA
jgi:hypothetical protein